MNAQLKPITARPRTETLRHYLELEAECRNASPAGLAADGSPPPSGPPVGAAELLKVLRDIAHTQAIESALQIFDPPSIEDGERAAKSESRGMGPTNGI